MLESSGEAAAKRPWRDELAERVAHFRHRRAQLRPRFDPGTTPELHFDGQSSDGSAATLERESFTALPQKQGRDPEKEFELVLGSRRAIRDESPLLDSISLDKPSRNAGIDGANLAEVGEWTLGPRPAGRSDPTAVEIVLDSHPASRSQAEPAFDSPLLGPAPLDRRFLAGVIDLLMLAGAACIFAGIFWLAGGHAHPQSAVLAVLALIASFFVFLYFGLFSTFAFSTPGQSVMELTVRNLEGGFPTPQESLWRAFGYLVSGAALMLGFVWALVDSDGLAWHDRMSGTCLVVRGQKPEKV